MDIYEDVFKYGLHYLDTFRIFRHKINNQTYKGGKKIIHTGLIYMGSIVLPKSDTQVTEKYVILILKKSPGKKFRKTFLKEEVYVMISFVFGIVVGLLIGIGLFVFLIYPSSSGYLRIDKSEPNEEPLLFLELSKNVQDIEHKDCVLLKIKAENYIPRK